jgi:hypothetical protein
VREFVIDEKKENTKMNEHLNDGAIERVLGRLRIKSTVGE